MSRYRLYSVTEQILLSKDPRKHAHAPATLTAAGATALCCCMTTPDDRFGGPVGVEGIAYAHFPLVDGKSGPGDNAWLAGEWIAGMVRGGHRVVVNCVGAKNRSPLAAALALHLLYGWDGLTCGRKVREAKPSTFYNETFIEFLRNVPERPQ